MGDTKGARVVDGVVDGNEVVVVVGVSGVSTVGGYMWTPFQVPSWFFKVIKKY